MPDNSEVNGNFAEKDIPLHSEKIVGETTAENHYYQQFAAASQDWRDDFEKKLMRKVDFRLVPLLIVGLPHAPPCCSSNGGAYACGRLVSAYKANHLLQIMYLNNFINRAALGQARLSTLEEDLGMTGTDFNLSISILFAGYLTMQLPSNLLITRVRPCK